MSTQELTLVRVEVAGARRDLIVWERLMRMFPVSLRGGAVADWGNQTTNRSEELLVV